MRILRADDVAVEDADRVFRHSRTGDALAAAAMVASGVALGAAAWYRALPLPIAIIAIALLFLLASMAVRTYRRSASPDNWLFASDESRILIKLRSHLNAESPEDRSRVIELGPADVVAFRVTKSRTSGHDSSGDPENTASTFLDILLSGPSADVAEAIRVERERQSGGAVWRHYPVTLADASTLRVEWRGKYARIIPRVEEATRILERFAPALAAEVERLDLGTSGRAPVNADVERQLRLLVDQGRVMEATVLAVRALGITQSEARRLIDETSSRYTIGPSDRKDGSAV